MKTIQIECLGYSVATDIYDEGGDGPILLMLIGRTSSRKKQHYVDLSKRMVDEQGASSIVFDYSGHGDSPFDIEDISAAAQFIEVVRVFDWMKREFPDRVTIVIGSSFGGFLATQLTKYRAFDKLILRAPAIYRPQDFYTLKKNEDGDATMSFRRNADELSIHPLLKRASSFKGEVLLIVHENDEHIPRETTDAYAKAYNAKVIIEKDITHSLGDATPEQVESYFENIYSWIAE